MRAFIWARVRTRRRLGALSAALVLSTSLTAPVLAADQTLSGALTGPITVNAPIDTLTNVGTLTANSGGGALILGGNPSRFKQVINTGEIIGTGTTTGIAAGVAIESFLNSGAIVSEALGMYYGGLFTGSMITNAQGGLIEGDSGAFEFYYGIDTFVNAGTLRSAAGTAFQVSNGSLFGFIGTFTNTATGEIYGRDTAVSFNSGVTSFENYGLIQSTGGSGYGFHSNGDVTNFTNAGGATITGSTGAYIAGSVTGTFRNDGRIEATSSSGDGVAVDGSTASFINGASGVIVSNRKAVDLDGTVDSFLNQGRIEADYRAIDFDSHVTTFVNEGTIANVDSGVAIDALTFGTFTNSGTIESTGTGNALYVSATVGSLINSGTFAAVGGHGITIDGAVTRFTNTATGVIQAAGTGVSFGGDVTTFLNHGAIASTDWIAAGVHVAGDVGDFTNVGAISAVDGYGVHIAGDVTGSFVNEAGGVISGVVDPAVSIDGSAASFINHGKITSTEYSVAVSIGAYGSGDVIFNSGTISGGLFGLRAINGVSGRVANSGTIEARSVTGSAGIYHQGGTIDNSGTISGYWGIVFKPVDPTNRGTVINSGTIKGTSGVAINFDYDQSGQSGDDSLTLLTGSRIFGAVRFADGTDTLDVSGYRGNAVLAVDHLETVVAGNTLVASSLDGTGTGTVSIVDATGITGGGAMVMGEVAGAIGGEIAGALSESRGMGPAEVMGYAPARSLGAAEAAADELVASAAPTGPEIWGKAFGGIANRGTDYSAVLGGIIAGSHAAVDANTRLGGVVSVSRSRFATVGQTIISSIGAAGFYGSTGLGDAALSYSVLAGVAANHSERTVTALVTETARADYASWFLSPELGLAIPLPLLDGVDTAAGFKVRYVGGGVGSYTEAGSSQNLSVGTSAVNLLDARMELTGTTQLAANGHGDVTVSATAGVLAQRHFGSAVSIAGFPFATTPASFTYGAYGDISLQAPIGPTSTLFASTGVEVRSDGASSASANLGLSATF